MNSKKIYDIVIIGAGLAGLSSALRLKKEGKSVLVIEKNGIPGGKLDAFHKNGFRFDNGPSLLTEPKLLDELFLLYNKDPRKYFNYNRQEESCRYFFSDSTSIRLFNDQDKTKEEIQKLTSEKDADSFRYYVSQAVMDYHEIGQLFIDRAKPSWKDFFTVEYLKNYPFFLSKKMRGSLHSHNKNSFNSPKLHKIFDRFGTYNGSNPYQMSGLFSMISSLELKEGSFFPENGMRSIIDGLYQLAKEVGIDFKFNHSAKVKSISEGFLIEDLNIKAADLICAIDHLTFYKDVLKDKSLFEKYSKQERSTSGLVFYWGIDTTIPELGLHNILFTKDYQAEFTSLFEHRKNYDTPTLYVHVSSAANKTDAPEGCQNLFIMINTSAYDNPSANFKNQMRNYTFDVFKKQFNVDLKDHLVIDEEWNNSIIEERTGSYLGALYGASSNNINASLKRHPNKSSKYRNLYFCGGTVHPGGGIPLVLRSAKIVSDLIK